jgi:hypothetical protein
MMSARQVSPFDVRRNGEPIKDVHIRDAVDPNISYSVHFSEWEAAIAAGATLDELQRLDQYPKQFRAKLIAWHGFHNAVAMHSQDAVNQKMSKKPRK